MKDSQGARSGGAPGIEIPGAPRARAALPLTLGVADGSGRVWGCCAQLAEAVGAS